MNKAGGRNRRIPFIVVLLIAMGAAFAGCSNEFLLHSGSGACDLGRDYEWYKTQMQSGPASPNNCGPAAVSMALLYSRGSDESVEEIRNGDYENGGWWYLQDVKDALEARHIGFRPVPLLYKDQLFSSLSRGHIVIVCLNMSLVTEERNNPESRANRFYKNVTGHFIILKGYSEDKAWLYAYDSNNWSDDIYADGSPKGKNRRYSADEVYRAVKNWNPQYLEI